jgi:Asp-tRNA(Asn)/Glu-tRNA(Gln) amidotransferase A subunit family amidase
MIRLNSKLVALLLTLLQITSVSAQSSSFDTREATISSVHHSVFNNLHTCRDVISAFLSRIELHNSKINAIINLNPSALDDADKLDSFLSGHNATTAPGPLFCIPTLLKDNYNTASLTTTGGNLFLANSVPNEDAATVAALRKADAIILGKVNLHELALEGLSVSSLAGQTINPYDFTRTPGGSSGGSGAALAASFAVLATGTDTVNSLRNPASANSLFSVRPTRGLISRAGVMPVSYTQDVLGVFGRCVEDVATGLTAMASIGFDKADNLTALIPAENIGIDYSAALASENTSLKGLRLGLITTFFNRTASAETTPVNDAMDAFVARLKAAGATVAPITSPIYNNTALGTLDVQRFEYRQSFDAYLSSLPPSAPHPSTLDQLYSTNITDAPFPLPANSSIHGNGKFLVIPSQYAFVETALASSTSNTTYASSQAGIAELILQHSLTFSTFDLDALIYPQQQNLVVKVGSPSQSGRNGILGALTGFPVVTVPIGFSPATKDAPVGVPIGMEIMARPWEEKKVLGIGKGVEDLGRVRRSPVWAKDFVEAKNYGSVPVVKPNGIVPPEYPVGVL